MITVTAYSGQRVAVFGLGKAGLAAVESLLTGGAEVYAWDDQVSARGALKNHAKLHVDNYGNWPWAELKALVLSPGVPLTHPAPHPVVSMAQEANCPVTGEVALLSITQKSARAIGVTGTNGKSTTTALIGHILQETGRLTQVGGNLGTPALALEPLGDDGIYVLEMSSYQLDLSPEVSFECACLLNISPDHLDRHGGMEGYIAAKERIFTHAEVAVIGVDDAYCDAIAHRLLDVGQSKFIPIAIQSSVSHGVQVIDGVLEDRRDGEGYRLDLRGFKGLKGAHNWQNAAVAYAACRSVGVDAEAIGKAMSTFGGLAHRMEWITETDGVVFVNDSKATNADAAARALAAYDGIYWIIGGQAKEGGISSLGSYFPRIRHAFLIGQAEAEFAETLEGHVPYTACGTLDKATRAATEMALAAGKPGVVLLSPAAASFDQWPHFEARGDAFRQYVTELVEKKDMAS